MKITFIQPAIGKKENEKYIDTWKMEPLTIATLKAFLPKDIETEFYDDRIELIDYDTKTDAVMITVETYTAARSYKIAKRFKARNIPVIMGGYHTTLVPEEVIDHCDSMLIGNAENIINTMIEDLKNNNLKKTYKGDAQYKHILPDRSIYSDKKYMPLSLIETGRGCNFSCEFCAVASYYDSCYLPRDIDDIIREIKEAPHKNFFFIDDNIVANTEFSKKLFKELIPLGINWSGQGSLTIAKDRELLKLMKKSGCMGLLIGFESMEEENLKQMNKDWRYKLGEVDELVKSIHDEGLCIYATFVFGFDFDSQKTFDDAVKFSKKHGFMFAAFNHLLPFPGTPLYDRLKKEGKISNDKWWLNENYKYGDVAFIPKSMSQEELSKKCENARRQFYTPSSIIKRGFQQIKRNFNPFIALYCVYQNIVLGKEVSGKMGLPVGKGLDTMPK